MKDKPSKYEIVRHDLGTQWNDGTFFTSSELEKVAANALDLLEEQAKEIERLKSMQTPRLMTLEEVKKADYVWLEVHWPYTKDHKPYLEIALPVPYEDWNHEDMILFRAKADKSNADNDCSPQYYGIVWRCWTAKPTLEQMRDTEWSR